MNVLDLFSGLGGFSKAFKDNGHQVVKIDNESKFNPDICIDILKLKKNDFNDYDFDIVLASPPCTEFTKDSMPDSWNENRKVEPDTRLLRKTIKIIYWVDPKYWVIENVSGARPYFYLFLGNPVKKVGSRYLWGNFPVFECKDVYGKWELSPGEDRPSLRSLIPYELSLSLCKMCEI